MKSLGRRQASTPPAHRAAHETRLYHQLQLAAHLARKQADRAMSTATGLSVAQIAVLNAIAAVPDATQRDVAAALGINESAVTAMVRRLVESGHVTRSDRDGRTRLLALTALGATATRGGARAFRPVNADLAGDLAPDEVRGLADQLAGIIDRLREAEGQQGG